MKRGGPVEGWLLLGSLATVIVVRLAAGRPAVTQPPLREPSTAIQVGLASWYGPGFDGNDTASGEVFDQRMMVAAHRTLRLGSVIRVTNLENGRQVTLRVIDRGPYGRNFRKGTIVDVSHGAARRLGFVKAGIVPVRLEVLTVPK